MDRHLATASHRRLTHRTVKMQFLQTISHSLGAYTELFQINEDIRDTDDDEGE